MGITVAYQPAPYGLLRQAGATSAGCFMSVEQLNRLRRTARIARSRHPVALLSRGWRYFSDDSRDGLGDGQVNALLLPLTLLALTVATVPGVSDAVAAACQTICMP